MGILDDIKRHLDPKRNGLSNKFNASLNRTRNDLSATFAPKRNGATDFFYRKFKPGLATAVYYQRDTLFTNVNYNAQFLGLKKPFPNTKPTGLLSLAGGKQVADTSGLLLGVGGIDNTEQTIYQDPGVSNGGAISGGGEEDKPKEEPILPPPKVDTYSPYDTQKNLLPVYLGVGVGVITLHIIIRR